jgi:hypothetical protein
MAHAYYALNDIVFGAMVGDKEIEKEKKELFVMLNELSKTMKYAIDVEAIRRVIDNLDKEENKESLVEEKRSVFRQQFEDLLTK